MAPVLAKKLSNSKTGVRLSKQSRAPSSHTTAEWNDIKSIFTRLYIEEDRPLKAVRKMLEEQHNFAATEKMLKTHITRWKIGKNRSERENCHALRIFRRAQEEGNSVSMTIRKQLTTIEDVVKHFTKKGIVDEDDLRSRVPNSPTPSTISYTVENNDEEVFENEDSRSTSYWGRRPHHNDEVFDVGNPQVSENLTLTGSASYLSAHDNHTSSSHTDQPDEMFARQFQRRLTLEDYPAWTGHENGRDDTDSQLETTVLQHLKDLLTMTLNSVCPKSPDFGPKCKGKAAIAAYASAVERNNPVEAMAQYHQGLDMMEEMTKVPNPFSIVYICELMRIALVSKNEAMPTKMLDYVSDMQAVEQTDHPLPLLVASVMRATGDDSARWRLLDLVYHNAIEMATTIVGAESQVHEALKRRYAVFCSQG